jgi:hypothetical protein
VVVGVGMVFGVVVGLCVAVAFVKFGDRTRPSTGAAAAAVGVAMLVAWLLARILRGERAVSACAAGGVTALAMLLWSDSGGE